MSASIHAVQHVGGLLVFGLLALGSSTAFAGQSLIGVTHVVTNLWTTATVPDENADLFAAMSDSTATRITPFDSFGGPVKVQEGGLTYVTAGWGAVLYRDCADAVFASDPTQPFIDPQTGLGPCEFLDAVLPLDVMTSMDEAHDMLDGVVISLTLDGRPLEPEAVVVKPGDIAFSEIDGSVSTCDDAYHQSVFPYLAQVFDYLDPSGVGPDDTCISKNIGAVLPTLSAGKHELVITYDLIPVSQVLQFPIAILVD